MTLRFIVLRTLVACGTPQGPESLAHTDLDGSVTFDDAGQLVLDESAQRTFDYVLSATDEIGEVELDAWMQARLRDRGLSSDQLGQVATAFADYRLYRRRAADVLADTSQDVESARVRLHALRGEALRDTPLSSSEAARIDRAFEVREALMLPEGETRQRALAAIDAEATAGFEASLAGRYLAARAAVDAVQRAGGTAAEVASARAKAFASFGPEAVQRLERLEASRATRP